MQNVTFLYVNHRSEARMRRVTPIRMWFGSTQWHPTPQWFVKAIDLDRVREADEKGEVRSVERDFAMADIVGWQAIA